MAKAKKTITIAFTIKAGPKGYEYCPDTCPGLYEDAECSLFRTNIGDPTRLELTPDDSYTYRCRPCLASSK